MCTAMDSPPCNSDTQEDILSKLDSRKSNKPLMEKKRRQRINRCLNDLKSLVLEGMKKDPSRYSKLEKADILEMTVRHVQALHRHEGVGCRLGGGTRLMGGGRPLGGDGRTKYRAGFIHCAVEVTRYLAGLSGVPHDLHHRLISHLNTVTSSLTCVPGVGQLPGASVVVGGGVVTVASPAASRPDASAVTSTTDTSHSVPHTLEAPRALTCRSPPPALFSGSAVIPSVTTSLTSGTSVALVPARLAPQQATQVLASSSALPQFHQPSTATQSTPPVTTRTHTAPDLVLTNSEGVLVPLNYHLPKNAIMTVPTSSHEAASGLTSSGIFAPRTLPLASNTLKHLSDTVTSSSSATHPVQEEVGDACTQVVTSVNQSHVTASIASIDDPQLCGPVTLSAKSPDKVSSSRTDPLGFQVSVRLSSATSPPVLSTPLWSSPIPVRPTPTLPTLAQHRSSSASPLLSPSIPFPSSSSPSSSSSSSCSSLSSSGSSTLANQVVSQHAPVLIAPSSREPLDLATDRPQKSAPRAHLKVLSVLPWSRPAPYPLPHRQPPGPSHPWRPW